METKLIKLSDIEALTIIHLIESEAKNTLRNKQLSATFKDYQLQQLRELHDKITNTFTELY